MRNLNFRSATDFEDFCCSWMTEIVQERMSKHVKFVCFGSLGQAQNGVDITSYPVGTLPVVAQCKWYSSRTFTLTDLNVELQKTDDYPNPIEQYFVLTTANPHTTIQNAMPDGYLTHMRKDGSSFKVYIYYWSQLENIDFLPLFARQRYFPEVYHGVTLTSDKNTMREQFVHLKQLLEEKLPVANLDWLETWNFSCGYMNKADFDPFFELVYEYNLVKSSFLDTPLRLKISECLPAGNGFFQALVAFRESVSSHIIGDSINGKDSLSVLDLPGRDKITRQWISDAEYLAKKYRDIVF
ncbi:hypothetical protein NMD73_17100 (plasmid) [Edwardsiella tarda]|uniref:hypothetical protein n=1 Tax=Edwardsiella tarda TaxID=636 RepID=UPI00351C3BA8